MVHDLGKAQTSLAGQFRNERVKVMQNLKCWLVFKVAVIGFFAFLSFGFASSIQVGKVNQSDALIAIVQSPTGLLIYVCGGANDWSSHTSWFSGAINEDGTFTFAGQNGLSISGKVSEKASRGELYLANGDHTPWQSLAVSDEGIAGLYRLASDTEVAGFIVAENKDSVGSIRLIRPAATEVLPLRLESELGVAALSELSVCYLFEAQETCLVLPKFQ